MDFADKAQLEKLSEALWDKMPVGRAAVMIGAGFSMNADPVPGNTRKFPSWAALANAMNSRLGADGAGNSGTFPKSFLRLASEYEAAFGRNDLNHLITVEIPDLEFVPSDLHLRLLELPWTDVFTTNYDTLLERTPVQKRAYHTVTKPIDLSRDRGARIIKLHGSFPSQTPFIITEDDFRTYPKKFAPLVNTVRQSLLENSFVLLGFSSEDPNFLNWSGWVRDQIGNEQRPIYLCGVLSLDTGQKRLLESQGIRLIDLSPVVAAIDDPALKHRFALEWFIEELHSAEPQGVEVWPEISSDGGLGRKKYLPPPLPPRVDVPEEPEVSPPLDEAFWMKTLSRWKAEREAYPGWVVAPEFIRQRLWENTANKIELLFSTTESWPVPEKLLVAWEVDWRISTSLGFYATPWLEKVEAIVEESVLFLREGSDFETTHIEKFEIDSTKARSLIFDLLISCARDARESFDFPKWQKWTELIEDPILEAESRQSEVDFQKVICFLWEGKRISARNLLNQYANCRSPYELLRRASLSLELDDLTKASDIAERALLDIREGLRVKGDNIELLSLEGWALFLINNIPTFKTLEEEKPQRNEFRRRWRELRIHLCDPWPIKEDLEEKLNRKVPSEKSEIIYSHAFRPFRQVKTESWKADTLTQFLPACSYLRLFETAAIPLRTSYYRLAGEAFFAAIRWTNLVTPGWTPALMVRRGALKQFQEQNFLSRYEVAILSEEQVQSIYKFGIGALQEIVSGYSSASVMKSGDSDSLGVCVEIVSRLAFRLPEAQLQESWEQCLVLHRFPDLPSHLTLHKVCDPWFERLIFCAPEQLLRKWLVPILEVAPFDPSSDSKIPESYRWIDPIRHYGLNRTKKIGLTRRATGLSEAVHRSLQSAKLESGELRDRLIARLIRLHIWGLLSKNDKVELGKLIWKNGSVNSNLPRCSGFKLSSFMQFPCPDIAGARRRMKKALLDEMPTDLINTVSDENVVEIAQRIEKWFSRVEDMTMFPDLKNPKGVKSITWTQTDSKRFRRFIWDWWNEFSGRLRKVKKGNVVPQAQFFQRNHLIDHNKPFRSFLKTVIFPYLPGADQNEIDKLTRLVSESDELWPRDLGVRVASIPVLSQSEISELKFQIEVALRSRDSEIAKDGLVAYDEWRFRSRVVDEFPKLPRRLTERTVERVAFDRDVCEVLAFDILISEAKYDDCLLIATDVSILSRAMEAWELFTRVVPDSSLSDFEKARGIDLRTSALSLSLKLLPLSSKREAAKLGNVIKCFDVDVLPEIRSLLAEKE